MRNNLQKTLHLLPRLLPYLILLTIVFLVYKRWFVLKEIIGGDWPYFFNETFETWGQDSIANDRHFIANGYAANAWKITPSDVDGKERYELIIELDSQRFFYPLLGLSILTFILILALFLRTTIEKDRRAR